jgi:hypothetical protein
MIEFISPSLLPQLLKDFNNGSFKPVCDIKKSLRGIIISFAIYLKTFFSRKYI